MLSNILKAKELIEELSLSKPIKVISHFDADGITSAAVFSRAMQRWGKKFSLEIVKGLDEDYISKLSEDNLLIFLDLASGSLAHLSKKNTQVIIFDHHEITQDIPANVLMINPIMDSSEKLSGAGVCYQFAKALKIETSDLATLALIGMVGDSLEKDIGKTYSEIIKDADATIKKGLLIYPSTRALDKALEYSSNPFIPGVTGSYQGVLSLLRDANIQKENGRFKALYELTEEEMSRLITAVLLRCINIPHDNILGNIYLLKFMNRMEDARELSALINACSRMDNPFVALGFCLGNKGYREKAEKIYISYKQNLVSGLKYVNELSKITGKNYTIINAKDNIKDTIIGTIASIISYSSEYTQGTMIIALAYNEDKIKVSARIAGREGRNVREVLSQVVVPLGGEVGGHPKAAGCLISRDKEELFISELKRVLDTEI